MKRKVYPIKAIWPLSIFTTQREKKRKQIKTKNKTKSIYIYRKRKTEWDGCVECHYTWFTELKRLHTIYVAKSAVGYAIFIFIHCKWIWVKWLNNKRRRNIHIFFYLFILCLSICFSVFVCFSFFSLMYSLFIEAIRLIRWEIFMTMTIRRNGRSEKVQKKHRIKNRTNTKERDVFCQIHTYKQSLG